MSHSQPELPPMFNFAATALQPETQQHKLVEDSPSAPLSFEVVCSAYSGPRADQSRHATTTVLDEHDPLFMSLAEPGVLIPSAAGTAKLMKDIAATNADRAKITPIIDLGYAEDAISFCTRVEAATAILVENKISSVLIKPQLHSPEGEHYSDWLQIRGVMNLIRNLGAFKRVGLVVDAVPQHGYDDLAEQLELADFAITTNLYDRQSYDRLLRAMRQRRIETPITAAIQPDKHADLGLLTKPHASNEAYYVHLGLDLIKSGSPGLHLHTDNNVRFVGRVAAQITTELSSN